MRKTFALLLLVCATAATATVFDHLPTDAELVDRSDLVVIGTVRNAATRVRSDNGWVVTDYELTVEETLKGSAGMTITLTEVGGVAGGRFTFIADSATYQPGQRVLVFLHRAGDGSYYTASMQFGKFEFTRNAQGASVLVRDTGEFGPEPARLENGFKAFVRGDRTANYQTTIRPITATALRPGAEFTAADYCETANDGVSTRPIRWPGGESGLTVPFFSNATDPGGIAAGTAAWTNEPAAFINLSYNGVSTSIGTGPNGTDQKNGIYLNYTAGPPPGIPCSDGVACAIESGVDSHTFQGQTFFSINDADIIVTPGAASNAVLIHELGHAIGFRHSNEGTPSTTQAVMNSSVSFTSLQQYDRDAADTVYGNGPACQQLSITGQPNDTTVTSGQTATLQVLVSGTNPTYQWYDGIKPDTSVAVGTNSNTFTTPPITAVKHYWVQVSNACSTVQSNTATITPQAPPNCNPVKITQQPVGGTINSGQTFTMSVQASGTTPFFIQWYEGQKLDRSNPAPNGTSATFTTPPLAQTKTYWVELTNGCGADQSNAVTVTVNIPGQCNKPSFTLQPQSIVGQSGQPAVLFALAIGDGTSNYQWFQGTAPDASTPLGPGQLPSNSRWISQIFVDVLGRIPSASDIATFTSLLGGSSRTAVALNLLGSSEYRANLLGSWFAQYLHRTAAAPDIAFFTPMFAASFTDEQIQSQILGSAEYFALAGGTNSGFVTQLFHDVLGRAPTPADLSFYSALLGSSSRTSVALSVLNSAEGRARLVQSYFARFLRRAGTSAEVNGLLPLTDEQIIATLLGSDEYFNFPSMLITPTITKTTSFWVQATNACGPTNSATATVTINCPLPAIATQPASVSVNIGQAPTLSVVATGATAYQWFVGPQGNETSPIAGATGPVLNSLVVNTAGATSVWVKVSNSCGSVNSNTANITVNCVATKPVISAPPVSPSVKSYPVTWTGNLQSDAKYELQESLTANFSQFVNTFTITDGTSMTFLHNDPAINADIRFYYRVRAIAKCGGDPSPFSDPTSVLVTAPLAHNLSAYSFAQLPCTSSPCKIQQVIHLDGFNAAGKTGIESTDTFNVSSDEPWITVSPSSGNLPAEGADVTMTIDASQLAVGSTQATLTENRTQGAGKTGTNGTTPTTTVPVNVSLVAPVTPKPKDGNAPLNALLIPATAHADGAGTRFVTDMRLTNTSSQSITYDLTFTPSNIDGTTAGKQITLSVPAGQSLALNDLVKDWFGSGTAGEVGIGSVEIRPRNYAAKTTPVSVTLATVASSRTYAVASTGTFGQYIPALPLMNFLAKSSNSVITLQQVAQSSAYRTNLGLVEGLGQPADVVVSLFDDHHNLLAQRPITLQPFESQQSRLDAFFNGFTTNGAPLPSIADARVEVSVTSDSGRVTAYASVLDNTTTDPLLVFPVDPSNIAARRFVVPGVAEFDNGFSNFHTDMRVFNAGATDANATINFSGSVSLPAVQRTIPAGQVLAVDNVLPTLWNASGGGAVNITTDSDAQLVVTARTYSRDSSSGGTFGQFIPGVTASDAVGVGDRTLQVVQLEQSPQFRSNLGLVEVTGNPVTVEILGYSPDSKVAATVQKTLNGGEFSQLGSIFTTMGFGDTYNGRITVRAIGGTGRVAAYGSVVDARTADPTYVPAQ